MKEVQAEYHQLSGQLKKEEEERNQMMEQIEMCFKKLEKMEHVMKEKNLKKQQGQAPVEPKKEWLVYLLHNIVFNVIQRHLVVRSFL